MMVVEFLDFRIQQKSWRFLYAYIDMAICEKYSSLTLMELFLGNILI